MEDEVSGDIIQTDIPKLLRQLNVLLKTIDEDLA